MDEQTEEQFHETSVAWVEELERIEKRNRAHGIARIEHHAQNFLIVDDKDSTFTPDGTLLEFLNTGNEKYRFTVSDVLSLLEGEKVHRNPRVHLKPILPRFKFLIGDTSDDIFNLIGEDWFEEDDNKDRSWWKLKSSV
jgi:hypothetical protein